MKVDSMRGCKIGTDAKRSEYRASKSIKFPTTSGQSKTTNLNKN